MGFDTNKELQLIDAFEKAVKVITKYLQIADGIVVSVDADQTNPDSQYTCVVQVGTGTGAVDIPNVPLRVLIGSAPGNLEVPVEGTDCLIAFRNGILESPQLLWADQVETKSLTVQQYNLKAMDQINITSNQTQGGIVLNGGKNGGLPMSPNLVMRLNNVENSINTLMQVFSTWTPVPDDGGAALKATAATWFAQPLALTIQNDIQNPAITQ